MKLPKPVDHGWNIAMVMLMFLIGRATMETAQVGRIKNKNDFTMAQKHATVQKMTDFQMSLSPMPIKTNGIQVLMHR